MAKASYVLDGQQRISTLFGTLFIKKEDVTYADVQWALYYDLRAQEFMLMPRGGTDDRHFPVRQLLDTSSFLSECRRIDKGKQPDKDRLLNEADTLANAFRDYQLPVITIKDVPLSVAVTAFARLNLGGRKMSTDQMVSALSYREGQFSLAKQIDEFKEELAHRGFKNLDRVFILRAVLAAMGRDMYAKDWQRVMVDESARDALPDALKTARRALKRALRFLSPLGVTTDRLLPYGLQLVLLSEFFRIRPKPSNAQAKLLEKWFWMTSFTTWFGGVNTAQVRLAQEEMQKIARGEQQQFKVFKLDEPAKPFPNRFDARSARVRAYMLYLVSLQPRSLRNPDETLISGELLSDLGPSALTQVVSRLDDIELASSPANRMFADRHHSGQGLGVLKSLSDDKLRKLLPTHGFPREAIQLLRDDDRGALVAGRLTQLIAGEREFLIQRNIVPSTEETGDILADSDATDDTDF